MSTTLAPLPVASERLHEENQDPFLFKRARTWWLLLALFLMAQGGGLFTRQDSSYWSLKELSRNYYPTTPFLFQLTTLMWVICAGLMVKWLVPTFQMMLKQKTVLAFLALTFLSTLWSDDPGATFHYAILLSLPFAFAWFFATYYSPIDQMRLLVAAGVIVAFASIAMALFLPEYGIASTGEWKGVFGHKNRMGHSIFYLFSALPFFRRSCKREHLTLALQAILPLGLILLTRSWTSLTMAVVLVTVRILGPYIASRRREQLPFVLFATALGIPLILLSVILAQDVILPLLGRDSTLSGRTEHWAILSVFALRHLWLGYGAAGFWTGRGDSLYVIRRAHGAMKGADGGYIDTMLSFGLLGIVLLLNLLRVTARDLWRVFRHSSIPLIAYWYVGVMLATLAGTFTEFLFWAETGIFTFVVVVMCAGLENLSHENASFS